MRSILVLLFFVCQVVGVKAQFSAQAKVYLLTCDPGDEIYTQFGHSALRFVDPESQMDLVFNWGMFEFGDSEVDFNIKFAKGKLDYYMGIQTFDAFIYEYQMDQRAVRQQELNLSQDQRILLWEALQENYKPENRVYKYDFFFDNCASRIGDFMIEVMGKDLALHKHKDADELSYREIINGNLQTHPWTDFGIDLVLGSRIDVKVKNEKLTFLPRYMEEVFAYSLVTRNGSVESFVLETKEIQIGKPRAKESKVWLTPNLICYFILGITLLLGFLKLRMASRIFGGTVVFMISILGLLILWIWVGTDHQATKSNFNLLWANPLLLVIFGSLFSKRFRARMTMIYLGAAIFMMVLVLFWIAIPQEFHAATHALILTLGVQCYFWYKEENALLKVKK